MARWLSNSEARRVQNVVETVERQSINKLPPQSRTWRPMSRGGAGSDGGGDGPNSPCGPCGPRLNASLVTLPGGEKAAQAYRTDGFNAVFGITGVRFEHLADGIYEVDNIYFECPEDPPPEEEDPEE